MIQTQNFVTQSIVRLEAQISELIKYMNEKTFPYQPLTNPDISNPIRSKNRRVLKTKIQFHHIHLNMTKIKIMRAT